MQAVQAPDIQALPASQASSPSTAGLQGSNSVHSQACFLHQPRRLQEGGRHGAGGPAEQAVADAASAGPLPGHPGRSPRRPEGRVRLLLQPDQVPGREASLRSTCRAWDAGAAAQAARRETDYESFLWASQLPKVPLLAPTRAVHGSQPTSERARLVRWQELRPAVFALRAFNVETGLVAETAKEPALARLRLTWWRDAVASMHDSADHNHPVVHALAAVRCPAQAAAELAQCGPRWHSLAHMRSCDAPG